MVGEFSIIHWVVVFGIMLLFFGPKKLPELAKGLGQGIRDFKKALNEEEKAEPTKLVSSAEKAEPVKNA